MLGPKLNFKQIRRRSLASFRTNRSTDTSSNDEPSNSSQEVSSVGSITPPSLANESDPALHLQIPSIMKQPNGSNSSNRLSIAESISSPTHSTKDLPSQVQDQHPLSQYAPRLTSITNKATVHQKILLVTGTIGLDPQPQIDGHVVVSRPDKAFPRTTWPVYGARFKAIVYLLPGPNTISFEYTKPGSSHSHRLSVLLYMFDPKNAPPLQLAILVAKDSPHTFEDASTQVQEGGNSLEVAVRKFRTAAYLWQSFTAQQMGKGGMGRRTFRFDEEWTHGTSHTWDFQEHTMRSEARVHVIRCDKTVAEIHELERIRQEAGAPQKNELVDVVGAALKSHFRMIPGQKQYVAALLLDSHRESKDMLSTAFGGKVDDDLHLAMFGSQCLQYYPSTICEVVQAFGNCSPTGLKIVANGESVANSAWEAAAYGIGAHLREVGRLLGSPRQESGIMAKDFIAIHRAFLMREANSTRTKSKGGPIDPKDEPSLHKLDLLRYRFHPLFRNAMDKMPHPDGAIHGWVVEKDKLLVTANSGLLHTELFAEGDEFCSKWIEHPFDGKMMRRTTLVEAELRALLPEGKRRSKLKVIIRSMGGGELVIDDFHHLCAKSSVKLTTGLMSGTSLLGKVAYRSTKLGTGSLENSESQEVVFSNAVGSTSRILTSVTVYHEAAVNGLEFHYEDGSSQLFGNQGAKKEGDRFVMDLHNAEVIVGFVVRVGSRIDAIEIITSTSRKSPIYGNANKSSPHTLLVPSGFKICGVSGTSGDYLDSFALLITR